VSQNQRRLTDNGKRARDELLNLLYPDSPCTYSQVSRDTGIDRATTIPKILGNKGNIQQVKLEQFFERLLRLLRQRVDDGNLKQNQVDSYLQNYRLSESYQSLWESDRRFYLPSKLHEFGDASAKSSAIRGETRKTSPKAANKKSSASVECNVTDLFWHLDYRQQEREFEDVLSEPNQCIAFSIAAPCDTTQRWILNRLRRQIPNQENALSLCISLKQNPMRNQFEHFWEDLSQRIGTKPLPSEVLKGMCHANVDRPIVLTIYEFRQFKRTQAQLFQDFWEPLTQAMVGSKRSERSRIVLFLVDQSCTSHDAKTMVKLDLLEGISQQDVTEWLCSNLVARWWQPKFGDGFEKGLADRLATENCQEPYFVLDQVCVGLGIKDGLMDVEEAWKWAS
jgi:hypothetical protein